MLLAACCVTRGCCKRKGGAQGKREGERRRVRERVGEGGDGAEEREGEGG